MVLRKMKKKIELKRVQIRHILEENPTICDLTIGGIMPNELRELRKNFLRDIVKITIEK